MHENYYSKNCNNCNQLATTYIKFQIMDQVYNQEQALRHGTLFPDLYRPYDPCGKNKEWRNYG